MAGPWEQYQTQPTAPEVGPWTAYAGQAQQDQGEHGYAPAPPEPPPPVAGTIPWNPVGDELGNIYTPSPPPSPADLRSAVGLPEDLKQLDAHLPGPPVGEPPVDQSRWREPNLAFVAGDPREALPPTSVDLGKIGGAMAEGWRGPVSLLPPGSDEAGQERLWGPYLGGAINTLARLPLGIPNALTYGAAEFANQVTGDPRAGRDVNMGAQVMAALFPLRGRIPSSLEMTVPPRINPNMNGFAEQTAPRLRTKEELFAPDVSQLDTRNAIQTLIQHDIEDNPTLAPGQGVANQGTPVSPLAPPPGVEPTTRTAPLMENFNQGEASPGAANQGSFAAPAEPPVTATEPPGPRGVGAAASRDLTPDTTFGRSSREIKGQQADMELADLMRTPQPGDARDIIPGATQTKAEIELSPDVSREAKGLRQEFREGFNEHEKANNELYHRHIDDIVPPREDIATMKDVREEHWRDAEKTVFGTNPNGEPVSTAPVVDHINSVLADPKEKFNSYLKKAFQPFLDELTDDNGNPTILGAKELYGLRTEMARKVKDMATDTDLAHVRGQFGDLLDKTDSVITTGAPSYRTMMDNYKAESGPINAAERLADIKLKVTNGSDRVITFGALDRYMKSLWMERHGPNPYAPAKSIPQATWDHLMTLHERLARSASADELARTKGSDTTQLMMEMARKGAIGAAHLLAAKVAPGLGNLAVPYITKQIDTRRAQKKLGQHLNPDLTQYPPVDP